MKRTLICIIALLCILPCTSFAQGYQVTPVTISSEKVTQDGTVYYVHDVLDHQTLFSICKAYGATFQEVINANKELDLLNNGLKAGSKLMIPVKDNAEQQTAAVPQTNHTAAATDSASQDDGYTEYVAKWYEDMTLIAAKFGIPKNVLMAYNGMENDNISRRQKIRIPNRPDLVDVNAPMAPAAKAAKPEKPVEEAPKPEKKEVAAAEPVKTANPVIETLPEENIAVAEAETEPAVENENEEGFNLKDAGARFRDLFKKKKDSITVGIALPFNARGQINDSAYDLYSGMLMAARDLSSQGVKAHLSVIDTRNQATPADREWLDKCDLVIGPISPDDIKGVLDRCSHNTPVISPLDPKAVTLASQHPNFIQAPSNTDAQYRDLIDWIKEDNTYGDKIILITEKSAAASPIQTYLESSGLEYATVSYGILESKNAVNRIESLMTATGTNRAIIASENEAFVNDAVRNLNLMTYKKKDVILYAPSKIRTFETVEVEGLHNIRAHVCCSYFVDYDSDRIKNFLLTYRAIFGAEPTPFAYQGYDAAYYFIRNFATSERDGERMGRMEIRKYRGLQSDFLLKSDDAGYSGYANQGIRRVIYDSDFSIRLAD